MKNILFILFGITFLFIFQSYALNITQNKANRHDSITTRATKVGDDYRSTLPSYIPTSPTVSSLMTYVDYPVSHYTGVPDISIPLYEIEIDNYKLPISLSYHSSGVKVNQEASWVGLGWSLNIGGVISRTIKCVDDFLEYTPPSGYIQHGYYNGPEANNPYSKEFYTNALEGSAISSILIADSEPDIFSFSIPGASGKFLIDKSRGAVLFDKGANINVEILADYPKKYFILTAPDGTQYEFKEYEMTYSYSRSGMLNKNKNNATFFDEYEDRLNQLYDSPLTYTSSWYLTKITTPNNRIIYFTYERESYMGPVQENCAKYNIISFSGTICGPGNNVVYSCSKTIVKNLRLSKISWDGGYIDFNCTYREDMIGVKSLPNPQKLTNLKIYNKENSCVKSYQFDYEYFNNDYQGNYKHVFKRLKLTKLIDTFDTSYNYAFSYNEGSIPAKNSKNIDYWGYYNGVFQESEYYCTVNYTNKIYPGADKKTQLNYMKIGSLLAIRYPTNESVQFTYEANSYMPNGPSTSTSIENIQEGMAVYQYYKDDVAIHRPQYNCDTLVLDRETSFEIWGWAENWGCKPDPDIKYNDEVNYPTFRITQLYDSGKEKIIFAYPVPSEIERDYCSYDFSRNKLMLATGTYIIEAFGQAKDVEFSFSYRYDKVFTNTKQPISAGGLRISRISGEKDRYFSYPIGKLLIEPLVSYTTRYTYFNGTSNYDITSYLVQVSESTIPMWTLKDGNSIGYSSVEEKAECVLTYNFYNEKEELFDDYPFLPTQINYYNGLTKSVSHSKQRIEYEYSSQYSHKIYGFMFNSGGMDVHGYNYRIEWPYKTKEIVTDYEDNASITTEKMYTYNSNLQMTAESIVSNGHSYFQKMTYPTDLTDRISQAMVNKNIINLPVEVIAIKNGKVTMGKKITYKDTLNMFVPMEQFNIETKTPLSTSVYKENFFSRLKFDHQNQWGKPMQVSDREVSIVYLWSYNGMYPVAELRNCSYQQVKQLLTLEFIEILCNKSTPTLGDMIKVNALRDSLPNASITTFTYSPLVGVASVTNPRNITTYFVYDSSGKLSESYILKNGIKQILEHYNYHYNND